MRRVPSSSLSDTKSAEQLAKSNGRIASKESARREIQTELRVRIGRDLMVDLIEIAKTVTRLKSIWQSQRRGSTAVVDTLFHVDDPPEKLEHEQRRMLCCCDREPRGEKDP